MSINPSFNRDEHSPRITTVVKSASQRRAERLACRSERRDELLRHPEGGLNTKPKLHSSRNSNSSDTKRDEKDTILFYNTINLRDGDGSIVMNGFANQTLPIVSTACLYPETDVVS